ncbi:S-adenosyl-L-methionine-dependent methyltransferase, partial [Pelagophyceae sp. CCMP2097]
KVLHVGCGTSSVGAELIRRGICEHVVNLDTSASCVERMRLKFEDIRGCEFQVGDACHMEHLGDETFEVVLDKGTLDALACKEGGEEARLEAGRALVAESHRVLRPGGSLVIASFGQPETRWRYLRDSGGGVDWAHAAHESVRVAATGSELHVYSLTKPRKQDRALPLDSRRRHMFDVATWAVGVAFCAVAITLALNSNRQKRASDGASER